jgi:hypothetical protein
LHCTMRLSGYQRPDAPAEGRKEVRLMAINGLGEIVLSALGVCVLAGTLAFLVAPVFSSEAFLQWMTTTPPCEFGG